MNRKIAFSLAFAIAASCAQAVEWQNIDEGSWLGGAKITSAEKLAGRIVLVDVWGYQCPPCKALLPKVEEIWKNFGLPANKPLVVVGSHRQQRNDAAIKALIDKHKLTYPVYQNAGIVEGEPSSGGSLPFMYVLDHRGKVIYKGRDEHQAIEVIVEALPKVGKLPSLCDGVDLVVYKNMEPRLVFGKPIKPMVTKLETEAKSKNYERAEEARKLLAAIEHAKAETKEEIDFQIGHDPVAAVKLIMQVKTTWPDLYESDYKDQMPTLVPKAKAHKAKQGAGQKK